jgi:hypothetical protein
MAYDPAKADEICQRLSDGEPLRQICRDEHMPAWRTVYAWIAADSELAARIAHARDLGGDAIAEDTLKIMDEEPERTPTEHGSKVDTGYVQWQKNRVEQRMKLLAKWNPKKYGERVQAEVNHTGLSDVLAAITGTSLKPVADDETD